MHTSLAKLLPLPTFLLQIVQREKREWTSIIVAKYPNFDWHVQHHKIATWSTCILDRVDRNIESGRWGLVVLFYASGAVWWVTPGSKLSSSARLESLGWERWELHPPTPNYVQKWEALKLLVGLKVYSHDLGTSESLLPWLQDFQDQRKIISFTLDLDGVKDIKPTCHQSS